MKKINSIIYNKLLLEAEEAKFQGLTKLAEAISESIGDEPIKDDVTYTYESLKDDIYKDLWKITTNLIKYYKLKELNTLKLNKDLESYSEKVLEDLEQLLDVDSKVEGTTEAKLLGED